MNYQSMEYFMAAATEGGFTAGARKLHITQQTISAGIAHLEEELGCRLFERKTPLLLTAEGRIFYNYAEDMLNRYQTMKRQFSEIAAGDRGILRLGIGYTRGRTVMPSLIRDFQEAYPDYQIILQEGSTEHLMQQLREGEVDVIVARNKEMDGEIEFYPFYNEQVVLAISRQLLIRTYGNRWETVVEEIGRGEFHELQSCPFVMSFPDDTTGAIAEYFLRSHDLQPKVCAVSDNLETLLALCCQGTGGAFCPQNLLEVAVPKESREELYLFSLPEGASYQICIGIRRQGHRWRILDEFIRIACDNCPVPTIALQ